ncbi:MAG TPA: HAD-IA family hydrolase [Chloroflexia bacterium]|nr:HAD-IA family hydrolase [Chloroflexia bacterium]
MQEKAPDGTSAGPPPRPPIQAVILDRDGVLTDFDLGAALVFFQPLLPLSLDELAQRWQRWGERVGFPRDLAAEQGFWQGFWDTLCDDLALSRAVREQLQRFDYTTLVRPFPDVRPALLTARAHGVRVGVLSNFSLASLDASLEAAGLADLVDVAAAAPVIGASKPAPAAYQYLLTRLGVGAAECLFFDDELPCVEGARALGLAAYLVQRRRQDHALAQGIVRDLSALPLLIRQYQAIDVGGG